jgi:hypothetical protein
VVSSLQAFQPKICTPFSSFLCMLHAPSYLIIIDVIILIFGEECNMELIIIKFSAAFHHFIRYSSKYFPKHPVLKHPQLMKMTVFWDVAPCSLVEVDWLLRGSFDLHHYRPDDGGSKLLWNVGHLLPDFTVQHPRRQSSSYSLPWEPEISPSFIVDKNLYLRILRKSSSHFSFHLE